MAITERSKDKYQIDIIVGYDPYGKRIRHSETFIGKKKNAKERENKIKAELKKGVYCKDNKITFNSFIDIWLNDYVSKQLAPKTQESYRTLLVRIKKQLGFYKLEEINPLILNKFYNYLRDIKKPKSLSPKTIKHYYTTINAILNYALQMQFIERNPNFNVKAPKLIKKEKTFYDIDSVRNLLELLENEPIKPKTLIHLALDSGCRRGELTGLEWEDINFNKNTCTINKVTQVYQNEIIEKSMPKNNSSIRIIELTPNTIELLKEYKEYQNKLKNKLGNKWKNSKKIFTTNEGSNMYPSTPNSMLSDLLNKYNLPHMNFHGLRHTSCSLQLLTVESKDYIKVSKRIGHSSLTTTLNVYSHIVDNDNQEIINKMNNILDVKKAG